MYSRFWEQFLDLGLGEIHDQDVLIILSLVFGGVRSQGTRIVMKNG